MRAIASAAKRSRDEPPHRRLFRRRCSRGLSGGSGTKAIPRRRAFRVAGIKRCARPCHARGAGISRRSWRVRARADGLLLMARRAAVRRYRQSPRHARSARRRCSPRRPGRARPPLVQVGRRRIGTELRPEHLKHLIARHAMAGSERKQLHRIRRPLLRPRLGGDRSRVHEHFEASEHPDLELRKHGSANSSEATSGDTAASKATKASRNGSGGATFTHNTDTNTTQP